MIQKKKGVRVVKKHIVCFGDSNTHGYCAEPADCADGGDRFNEAERWPCVLGSLLGEEYRVLEEGLEGRTTVFEDPLTEGLCGLNSIYAALMCHKPVDLLIIMLGTNDTKERFGVNPECISKGMERLVNKAKTIPAWPESGPNILIICPPHIMDDLYSSPVLGVMGNGCPEKSRLLAPFYAQVAKLTGCHFLDAEGLAEFNHADGMHLTRKGHTQLATWLAKEIPGLVK